MPFVGWDGMDGMVVVGHRSSKSTFGANNMDDDDDDLKDDYCD